MAKYLIEASYSREGAKGLLNEGGSKRRAAVEEMVKSVGGKVDAFYYSFGDTDVYAILDAPESVSAAALSLAVNASGAVQLRTQVLISPEEMDRASQKSVSYRPPG